MAVRPIMRRWTDRRDGRVWRVVYAPGVEEDPPMVRYGRESLLFEAEGDAGEVPFRAPAVFGSDLGDLTDGDLAGLLDQARAGRKAEEARTGWGRGDAARAEVSDGDVDGR